MIRGGLLWMGLSAALVAQGAPVQESTLRAHMAFLADDLLEGRGPGSRGGLLAVRYLEAQLKSLGLKPAFGDSYLQPVPLVGLRNLPGKTRLSLRGSKGALPFTLGEDFLVGGGVPREEIKVDAPLLFVGHGVALEGRDDFKGVDVRGKVLLVLVGRRGDQDQGCCSPSHFANRWAYKIREARRRGAAGVFMIHEPNQAGYDWGVVRVSWTQERYQPGQVPGGAEAQGWLTRDATRRLFQAAGLDFDHLRREAEKPGFKPVPLVGLRLTGEIRSAVRRFEDMNVAAILLGTDPELSKELVVYSAHWDHLGRDPKSGRIFNGAVDNASGCAGVLAIAQAAKAAKRSQMFLFPCAEEPGLLGAEGFLAASPWPLAKVVAALNLESLNFAGPTRDIGLAGAELSSLHGMAAEVAAELGLSITPARPDPAGLFFRSDHFPFVKVGIPAFSPGFSLDGGWDFLRSDDAQRAKAYVSNHYHQTSDRYDPAWDLRGMLQQIQFTAALGRNLSERPDRPVWRVGPVQW